MEVCFVDVAQGAASVILLGSGRAMVIDCGGRQARTLQALLTRFGVQFLERLVVTHNHADHSAGAAHILTAYRRRIGQIWMLYDTVLTGSHFWDRLNEEQGAGHLRRDQLRRLECQAGQYEIYHDNEVLLSVISPDLLGNLHAVRDGNPNATSGILVLKHASRQVVFAGDSTIEEWRVIHENRGGQPIRCMLLTVPHHGGRIWEPRRSNESDVAHDARVAAELDWLYTQAIIAEVGVVSVGTSNSYGHPRVRSSVRSDETVVP